MLQNITVGMAFLGAGLCTTPAVATDTETSSTTQPAPSLRERTAAEQLRQATQRFEHDPASALTLLDQACSAHPFVECSINRAFILESLENCEALIYFQRFLSEQPTRDSETGALKACTQMATQCSEDPAAYCVANPERTGDRDTPASGAKLTAQQPYTEPDLAMDPELEASSPTSRPVPTASTGHDPESPANSPAGPAILGVATASAGLATAVAFAVSFRKFQEREQDRELEFNRCQVGDLPCGPLMQLEKNQQSRQRWLVGLGVASGLLLTAGGVLWRADSRTLRWKISAGSEPHVGLVGRF